MGSMRSRLTSRFLRGTHALFNIGNTLGYHLFGFYFLPFLQFFNTWGNSERDPQNKRYWAYSSQQKWRYWLKDKALQIGWVMYWPTELFCRFFGLILGGAFAVLGSPMSVFYSIQDSSPAIDRYFRRHVHPISLISHLCGVLAIFCFASFQLFALGAGASVNFAYNYGSNLGYFLYTLPSLTKWIATSLWSWGQNIRQWFHKRYAPTKVLMAEQLTELNRHSAFEQAKMHYLKQFKGELEALLFGPQCSSGAGFVHTLVKTPSFQGLPTSPIKSCIQSIAQCSSAPKNAQLWQTKLKRLRAFSVREKDQFLIEMINGHLSNSHSLAPMALFFDIKSIQSMKIHDLIMGADVQTSANAPGTWEKQWARAQNQPPFDPAKLEQEYHQGLAHLFHPSGLTLNEKAFTYDNLLALTAVKRKWASWDPYAFENSVAYPPKTADFRSGSLKVCQKTMTQRLGILNQNISMCQAKGFLPFENKAHFVPIFKKLKQIAHKNRRAKGPSKQNGLLQQLLPKKHPLQRTLKENAKRTYGPNTLSAFCLGRYASKQAQHQALQRLQVHVFETCLRRLYRQFVQHPRTYQVQTGLNDWRRWIQTYRNELKPIEALSLDLKTLCTPIKKEYFNRFEKELIEKDFSILLAKTQKCGPKNRQGFDVVCVEEPSQVEDVKKWLYLNQIEANVVVYSQLRAHFSVLNPLVKSSAQDKRSRTTIQQQTHPLQKLQMSYLKKVAQRRDGLQRWIAQNQPSFWLGHKFWQLLAILRIHPFADQLSRHQQALQMCQGYLASDWVFNTRPHRHPLLLQNFNRRFLGLKNRILKSSYCCQGDRLTSQSLLKKL